MYNICKSIFKCLQALPGTPGGPVTLSPEPDAICLASSHLSISASQHLSWIGGEEAVLLLPSLQDVTLSI